MDQHNLERCRRVLERAAPHGTTNRHMTQGGRLKGGEWPRLELINTRTVRYAYLLPSGGSADLRVFPGDTLTQARRLYEDPVRSDALLRLRERGWRLTPNMHFGFAARGFSWMTVTADVEEYVKYWLRAIDQTWELERNEWPRFVADLIQLGFASAGDEATFENAFTKTNRQRASPRPGLQVTRQLETSLQQEEALAAEVASALREVLAALREPHETLAHS